MVLFFTCISDPNIVIYMGKDKYENEELIKYAWPDLDVWFHVSDLSSAHVYLRVPEGITSLKDIPDELVQECAQLTKANSIEGCKKDRVGINITWARNLKKTPGMETGAVSFHKPNEVLNIKIEKDAAIVKALMKTKREEYPDLKKSLEAHVADLKKREALVEKQKFEAQKAIEKEKKAKEQEKTDFFAQQRK